MTCLTRPGPHPNAQGYLKVWGGAMVGVAQRKWAINTGNACICDVICNLCVYLINDYQCIFACIPYYDMEVCQGRTRRGRGNP